MNPNKTEASRAEALRVISGAAIPHRCGTCFHVVAGGGCSLGAAPARPSCPWWVISFSEFLRAVKRWQKEHPGQIPEPVRQDTGPRIYNLERYGESAEGFFPASCQTCTHWKPGEDCPPRSGTPCQRWAVSPPFFLMGAYFRRLRHPWPEL